jgi:NTE family protein
MQVKPGESVSIDHIQKRLQLIYGTLYFEKLWYEILGPQDHQILKIHVTERPKSQLRFSYHYDSENKGGVVVNATVRNVLLNHSRLIMEADLATFPRLTLDYFKYLGKKQNIAAQATGLYFKNELPVYDSAGNLNILFSTDYASAGLRFQTTFAQNGAFGVEAKLHQISLTPKVAENTTRSISKIQYNNTSFSFYYRYDNTNDRYFPTRGLKSEIKFSTSTKINGTVEIRDTLSVGPESLGDLLQTNSINAIDLTLFPIIPLSSKFSLLLKSRLRLSNLGANTLNFTDYDFIGGFIPSWINSNEYLGGGAKEFIAANYFYGRLSMQYNVRKNMFLQGHFNYLNSDVKWVFPEAEISKLGDRYMRFGYGATLGYSSPIGPIAFSFAKDHFREEWKATLAIGFYY